MYFNESISLYSERSKEYPGGERIKGVCPILIKRTCGCSKML
jgi:hypothetical protein